MPQGKFLLYKILDVSNLEKNCDERVSSTKEKLYAKKDTLLDKILLNKMLIQKSIPFQPISKFELITCIKEKKEKTNPKPNKNAKQRGGKKNQNKTINKPTNNPSNSIHRYIAQMNMIAYWVPENSKLRTNSYQNFQGFKMLTQIEITVFLIFLFLEAQLHHG